MDTKTPLLRHWSRQLRRLRPRRGAGASIGVTNTSAARRERLRRMVAATGSPRRQRARTSPARAGLAVGTTLVLSLLLCIHLWPNRVDLHLHDVADQEIVAQRSVQFEDTAATAQMRADAEQQVERRYTAVPGATSGALDAVENAFDLIDRKAGEESAPGAAPPAGGKAASVKPRQAPAAPAPLAERRSRDAEWIVSLLRARAGDEGASYAWQPPTAAQIAVLLGQGRAAREGARRAAVRAAGRAMGRSITDEGDDLQQARLDLSRDPAFAAVDGVPSRAAAAAVAAAALRPTRRLDERATEHDRRAAAAAVPAQMTRYTAGQVIVRPGDRVTQVQLDAFAALGLQNARLDAVTVGVILLMVGLLVALVAVYLRRFHADLYDDTPRLLLLALLCVISVVGLKIGSTLLGLPFSWVHVGYLGMMCVASAGMVIALLISPSVATLIVGVLSIASGLILNNELRFTVITLVSSLVGIVSVAHLRNRGDLIRAMLTLCTANVVLNVVVGQLQGDLPQELLYGAGWGVVSGLFALVLFWMGVAVFEKPFGITTHLRLLELTDPATPILQEFRMRVPGTYAHSLMVGNLAHAAAEAVGADALLVRVAAYYHDLGKMSRPEFFIENQANAENVHDRISPSLSALILSSHVKEGLEMAEGVGLPPRVREVIQQHHGTTLMKYFYHRATGGVPDPTLEAQFRYPGPKPQTREAAILMLADGVEAASRTLDKPTPTRIAEFVGRMIDEKLADGQLDECDLTMRDLRKVQEVFARTLAGTLHARIEYPNSPANGPAAVPALPAIPAAAAPPTLALAGAPEADPEEQMLRSLLNTGGADTPNGEPFGAADGVCGAAPPFTLPTPDPLDHTPHGTDAANGAPAGQDAAGRPLLGPRPGGRAKTARGGR